MTVTACFSVGFSLWRFAIVLLAATSTSPIPKLVEEYKATYHELMHAENRLNFTNTIHFSYVPPEKQTLPSRENAIVEIAALHNQTKLPALYLPGIDGSGFSASTQFKDLSRAFELWRLTVDPTDRSTLKELVDAVTLFVDDLASLNGTAGGLNSRKILLIGESFGGGLLAPIVALRRKDVMKGLVLVSPFIAINSTLLTSMSPLVTTIPHESKNQTSALPTPYSIIEGLTVGLSDRRQFQQLVGKVRGSTQGLTGILELFSALQQGFRLVEEALPADTIEHRLYHWLSVGSSLVSSEKLETLDVPALLVSGGGDTAMPNKKETILLLNKMPRCNMLEFDNLGHYLLRENVNLTRIILQSNIFASYDPILDWKPPPRELVDKIGREWIARIEALTGPVFFSSDVHGKRHKGLGHVPNTRPLLFVANHQLGGLDLQLYVAQLIIDRDIFVRGLGHPVIFQGEQSKGPFTDLELPFPVTEEEGGGEGITRKQGFYERFGAVPVNPRNFYRLMETGQPAILLPGGIREAFHGKNEAYELFWPEKVDFVRTAAKFNATIVPISAVGAADSADIIMDADDIQRLPFGLGEGVENSIWALHRGRYDDNDHEFLHPPLILPKLLPARHYFVFGKPFSTEDFGHNDKQALDKLYRDIKQEVERGISDLLKAREKDPYRNTVKRILYEKFTGKSAPTFCNDALN